MSDIFARFVCVIYLGMQTTIEYKTGQSPEGTLPIIAIILLSEKGVSGNIVHSFVCPWRKQTFDKNVHKPAW